MVDLQHNATHNDASPALFGSTKARVSQHVHHKVEAEAMQAPQDKKEQQESPESNSNINLNEHSTNNDQHRGRPTQHKNQHTVYKGTDGFTTTSWDELQKWIHDRCAKGLAWSYKYYSTWTTRKRSSDAANEESVVENADSYASRKGTSKFVHPKMSLHRRLMRKRRITTRL